MAVYKYSLTKNDDGSTLKYGGNLNILLGPPPHPHADLETLRLRRGITRGKEEAVKGAKHTLEYVVMRWKILRAPD